MTIVDPAWLWIERIDDTDPRQISVLANADTRLERFEGFINRQPYGGGWGTGRVWVTGLPTSAFNGDQASISVRGCGQYNCAEAFTATYVQDTQKTNTGSITVAFPEQGAYLGLQHFNRSIVISYRERSYAVPFSPGGTKRTFLMARTGLSFPMRPTRPVTRSETLDWRVYPASYGTAPCSMRSEAPPSESIDNANTVTEFFVCDLNGVIASAGDFDASVGWVMATTLAGTEFGRVIFGGTLGVSVP